MNEVLERKIKKLEDANDYECWYLVKHDVDFGNLCYMISVLEDYKLDLNKPGGNFAEYFSKKIKMINAAKGTSIPDNYRTLRLGCFFGLISKYVGQYTNAVPTQTYYEIKKISDGNFEKIELYNDIIRRQIEKIYISSSIDEEYDGVRKNFRIFPVIFLYKILLELGRTTGVYSVSMNEYDYLIATTEKYEDFLQTLFLINLLRKESNVNLDKFSGKFDSRFNQALKLLVTLDMDNKSIAIKQEYIDDVSQIVFNFEKNKINYTDEEYLKFLGSTDALTVRKSEHKTIESSVKPIIYPHNRILFGAPGSGKSYKLEKQRLDFGENYERVTFHPNYTYAQFVGTYKPKPKFKNKGTAEEKEYVSYEFVAGPFLRVWVKAKQTEKENYLLIIEEINRANVSAVFGDIFQLLDREESGDSEYKIATTEEMRDYLESEGFERDTVETISIPRNMYIWATMNSADQGVSPIDTAFKRRWYFEYVGINEGSNEISDKEITLKLYEQPIYWDKLRSRINDRLTESDINVNEDKLIGPFFLNNKELSSPIIDEIFKNKLLMYLFDDVLKHKKGKLFKPNLNTFSKIIDAYDKKENIFDFEVSDLFSSPDKSDINNMNNDGNVLF
jgi:hypothetical protein